MSDASSIAGPCSSTQEKVIVEVSVGSLYPVLPQHTGRYNVATRVTRSHAVVGAGMFMAARSPLPQYLPTKWSALTHPEGQVYFLREGPIKVVTDACMHKPEVSEKIVSWVQIIEKELVDKSIFTFPNTVELYVQLEDEDCNYYFADHNTRTLFWLDDYNTVDLGLLPVVSQSHLKLQLEEHYWTHVEYHCMHSIPFTTSIVEEAISQLIHACGDQMTSSTSTFPYTFQQSKDLLDILTPARLAPPSGHITTTIARLFNAITHSRYWSHYGQEQARLSRDTSILASASAPTSSIAASLATLSAALTFGSSTWFEGRLSTIFTDDFVYGSDWQTFIKKSQTKWRGAFAQSLALLALHVFCFLTPGVSQGLAVVSSGLFGSSIFTSALLTHQHQDMEEGTAGDAYVYLTRNKSEKLGFHTLALLFALPQALSLWGMLLTAAQALAFVHPTHLYISFIFSAVLTSLVLVSKTMFSSASDSSASSPGSATIVIEKETESKSIV